MLTKAASAAAQPEGDYPRTKQYLKQELFTINAPRMLAFCIAFIVLQVATLFYSVHAHFPVDAASPGLMRLFAGDPWSNLKLVMICAGVLFAVVFALASAGVIRGPQARSSLITICLPIFTLTQFLLCFLELGGDYFLHHYVVFALMLGVLPVLSRVESTVYLVGFTALCWITFALSMNTDVTGVISSVTSASNSPFNAATSSTNAAGTGVDYTLLVSAVLLACLCASWFTFSLVKKNATIRFELEMQEKELENLVAERTEEYRKKAHAAEISNLAKTRFLTRVSHEMRTSMNTISGMLFLAKESDDPASRAESLEAIDQASHKLRSIVGDIIDTTRIELDFSGDDYNQDFVLLTADATQPQRKDEHVQPPNLEGHTILIVEDIETNRIVLREFLKDTKATIEEAHNGREAIEKFAASPENKYSFVFMDLLMPEVDGHEAARTIRRMEREDASQVPIVAVSANAFKEDIEASLAAGMDAHIAKPVEQATIFRILIERLT